MWLVYRVVRNYGVAIFIFTLISRLITFPVSVQQQKSTAATAAINPKLERLKKQYANNQQKLQEEQMKLYSEEGINPMASCLPMIVQLGLLYGVFDVIYRPISYILRLNKDVIESIKTAAAPLFEGNQAFNARPELYLVQSVQSDPQYYLDKGVSETAINAILDFNNKIFGVVDLGTVPKTVFEGGFTFSAASVGLILIPVIAGILQLATSIYTTAKQKKLNPETAQQMAGMNVMFYAMPLLSVWMGFSFAAGLGFYWICSSLVGIIQTVVLNKIYTPEYVQKLIEKDKAKKKNKKRSALGEKYRELMAQSMEQMNAQNGGQSAKTEKIPADVSKLSNSQMKDYERKIIAEARRRQAEKYGDDPDDDSE